MTNNNELEKQSSQFLADIKKMRALENQIEEERENETESVQAMSEKERLEYLKQKSAKAEELAKNVDIGKKNIVFQGNRGV